MTNPYTSLVVREDTTRGVSLRMSTPEISTSQNVNSQNVNSQNVNSQNVNSQNVNFLNFKVAYIEHP